MGEIEMRTMTMRITRRQALVAGGMGAALATVPMARQVAAQRAIQSGGGIAGGGSVEVKGGTAHFSVFGSRFVIEGEEAPLIVGSFIWTGADDGSLVSSEVTSYGPVDGDDASRQMTGTLTMDGAGSFPFTLTLTDGGGPGGGDDTVTLTLLDSGDNAAPSPAAGDEVYTADGPLASGDLQLLTFDFEE